MLKCSHPRFGAETPASGSNLTKETHPQKNLVENPPPRSSSSSETTGFATGLCHKKCLDFSIQTENSKELSPPSGRLTSHPRESREQPGLARPLLPHNATQKLAVSPEHNRENSSLQKDKGVFTAEKDAGCFVAAEVSKPMCASLFPSVSWNVGFGRD